MKYQGHEIYNLSEKELLYKQRISLELLEVMKVKVKWQILSFYCFDGIKS